MKKKYIFLILGIIFFLIFGTILFKLYNMRKEKVLADSNNQVKVLYEMYNSFLIPHSNVIFDDSAFENFITKEEFSNENKEFLKKAEKHSDNIDYPLYTMHVSYDPSRQVLTLSLYDSNLKRIRHIGYFIKSNLFEIKYQGPSVISLYNN